MGFNVFGEIRESHFGPGRVFGEIHEAGKHEIRESHPKHQNPNALS